MPPSSPPTVCRRPLCSPFALCCVFLCMDCGVCLRVYPFSRNYVKVEGIAGVLETYRQSLKRVELSSPTYFAPVIKKVMYTYDSIQLCPPSCPLVRPYYLPATWSPRPTGVVVAVRVVSGDVDTMLVRHRHGTMLDAFLCPIRRQSPSYPRELPFLAGGLQHCTAFVAWVGNPTRMCGRGLGVGFWRPFHNPYTFRSHSATAPSPVVMPSSQLDDSPRRCMPRRIQRTARSFSL